MGNNALLRCFSDSNCLKESQERSISFSNILGEKSMLLKPHLKREKHSLVWLDENSTLFLSSKNADLL